MAGKQTRGRQKIEMKMIENEDDRLITFSKRRSGIYKKASELSTLCGAKVGVVIFSPSGKPFSFGHPSIEHVANLFLNQNQNQPSNDNTHPLLEAHRSVRINELNQKHNELVSQLEAEKEREKVFKQLTKENGKGWWEAPVEDLGLDDLKKMDSSMVELHKKLWDKINEKSPGAGSSSSPPAANPSDADPSTFSHDYGYGSGNF